VTRFKTAGENVDGRTVIVMMLATPNRGREAKMKHSIFAALAAASLGMAVPAQADTPSKRGGWLLNMDLDFGGDDLATVSFEDGESQDVKAGQGIHIGVGGWFRPMNDVPFELQGILGYKFVTTAASNADIGVARTTLQLNGIYRFSNAWYLGGGITRHMGPELDGDGFFEDISFDDATGFTMEAGWKWIGLHYTRMDYSADGYQDADASHFGVRFTWRPGT
jgi:hypothetical protein